MWDYIGLPPYNSTSFQDLLRQASEAGFVYHPQIQFSPSLSTSRFMEADTRLTRLANMPPYLVQEAGMDTYDLPLNIGGSSTNIGVNYGVQDIQELPTMTFAEHTDFNDTGKTIALVMASVSRDNNMLRSAVIPVQLTDCPTILEVLHALLETEDTRGRGVAMVLKEMPMSNTYIATSLVPRGFKSEGYGNPLDGYVELGFWTDIDNVTKLPPVKDSPTRTELMSLHAPTLPEGTPLYLLYLWREHAMSISASSDSPLAVSNTAAQSTINNEMDSDVTSYLQSAISKRYRDLFTKHVIPNRSHHSAFAQMIFARIIQQLCIQFGVRYEKGCCQSDKFPRPNGPSISMDDIIESFGCIRPKTFGNYRSLHHKAHMALAELRDRSRNNDERNSINTRLKQHLTELLTTDLDKLDDLTPATYKNVQDFTALLKDGIN
jgi:hypothetical protein